MSSFPVLACLWVGETAPNVHIPEVLCMQLLSPGWKSVEKVEGNCETLGFHVDPSANHFLCSYGCFLSGACCKMQHAEIRAEERNDVVSQGLKIPPK